MGEFHKAVGYTPEILEAGMKLDEFIWKKYVKDVTAASHACFQLHIIEYLLKYSASFKNDYEGQYDDWIAVHTKTLTE